MGTLFLSGGYDAAHVESDLAARKCDLIAAGKPFLANRDLVVRWKSGSKLNAPDMRSTRPRRRGIPIILCWIDPNKKLGN